jgi:type IV secretion system protein VirB4
MPRLTRSEIGAEEYVPYFQHASPDVVLLRDGSRLAMFRVIGRGWETADPDEAQSWHNQLNVLVRNIASDRLILSVHLVRTAGRAEDYPRGQFRSAFARQLDAAYRDIVVPQLYRNELFLSVLRRPSGIAGSRGDRASSWFARMRRTPPAVETASDAEKHLQDVLRVLEADLEPYGLTRLGLRQEGRVLFSEPAEALSLILTGQHRKVPLTTGRLGCAIHTDRVIFGRESIEIRGDGASTFAAVLGLREYPAQTWPGQFSTLLAAPYFFVLTQTFAILSKGDGMAAVTRKQNQMVSANDKAASQREELSEAADRLMSNAFVMGSHHLSLTVFADSMEALPRVVARARSDLAESGPVVVREDLALEAAIWAQFPGNAHLRPRPGVMSSRNWAAMAPLHNYPTGPRSGYWGAPIALFRTTGGTPYFMHYHVGDLANIVMFGPSGSGKTTLLLTLLVMAEKTGAVVVFFDKDRGGEILARAVGGTYLVLPSGSPTGMAPLRALSATPADVEFLTGWVTGLIVADGFVPKPEDERHISQAVETLLRLPPELRSLAEMRAFLGQADVAGAGAHLAKWCRSGSLGWAFDGETDRVSTDAPFLGFDMTAVLDDPDVRGPAMAYLFHRISALMDGRRLVLAIDEFWKALTDPVFRDMVNDKLKTIRKLNGVVILATQSPRDALASPIAHTLVEQCPTQILMPNPRADAAEYRDGLKLTEPEFQMVREDLTMGGRRFLLKQGTASVACDLDLSEAPECVAVLSGRASTVRLMERIIEDVGEEPAAWLPAFTQKWKEIAA